MSKNEDKKKFESVSDALKFIRSNYGKESIVSNEKMNLPSYSTNSMGLDYAIGNGGFVKGRIVELFGTESSGKTTIACEVGKNVQKENKAVLYVDFEHSVDLSHAKKDLGLDLNENKFVFVQPDCFEDGIDIICNLVDTGLFGLVVIDSVAAMTPRSELEGEMDDKSMGLMARLMGQAIRKLKSMLNRTSTLCIFINQVREQIGNYCGGHVTPGGKALKFFASTRVKLHGKQIDGGMVEVDGKVVKNKVAPAMRDFEFKINKFGIMSESEIVEKAIEYGYIKKVGSWLELGKLYRVQGIDKVSQFLNSNPKLLNKLKNKMLDIMETKNESISIKSIDKSLVKEIDDKEIDEFLNQELEPFDDLEIEEDKEIKKEKKKRD